jgi:hypothetical protein
MTDERELAVREPADVEAQPVEVKPVAMDADEFAAQQKKHVQAMRRVAVATALPCFFDRFGNSPPRMNSRGGNHYRRLFGISTEVLGESKEILTDEHGEYWSYECRVRASAIQQPTGLPIKSDATGTCTTRDEFFGVRKDATGKKYFLPLSEVDKPSVKKKAETNARIRATEALLGFYPTWEDLEAVFGAQTQQVSTVTYGQDQARASGKGVVTDAKKELNRLCYEMAYEDVEKKREICKRLSAFTTKDGKEIPGQEDPRQLSDKRAEVTLRKAQEEYARWQNEQGGEREPGMEG